MHIEILSKILIENLLIQIRRDNKLYLINSLIILKIILLENNEVI